MRPVLSCEILLLLFCAAAGCLPDAVPELDRAYIKDVTGKDVEIRLIAYDWPSAEFVTALSNIMIREALGYKAKINEARGVQNLDAVLSLTGCNALECTSQTTDVSHIAMETWLGTYGGDYDAFKERHPDKVPEDLGGMGYLGEEAVFVSRTLVEEAYAESGHSFNWYRSYNASRSFPTKYFSSVLDLPIEEFRFCNESELMWTDPIFMNGYALWSGDVEEGLVQVGNEWHANCHAFGRFWLSPACRHNVSECVPMLSHEYGWLVDAMMHWSTAYAMPIAIGILGPKFPSTAQSAAYFYSMTRTFKVLSHWFLPDTAQVAFNPLPMIFPVHSASEWAVGNKRTAASGSYIGKLVNRRLREQAFKVLSFLENLKLELNEMQQYLGMKDNATTWDDVACQWVTSNRQRWEAWVPKETTCFPGFGLVDAAGNTVATRETATGCSLCTPGRASKVVSDEIGRTYTCELCSAGTYQELSGETLCISCPAGRIASDAGRSQCEACPPGSYANSSGLTSCQLCGDGDFSWTTSRMTEVRGSQQWIQVEAAVSEELCHCIPGWFLSTDQRCYECTEGASCPGSSQVEVLPGYFSFSNTPGSIYKCYRNTLACPGGDPGTCAVGRDNSTVACSACMAGLHSTDEGCIPCQGQDYLVLVVVCCLILVTTGGVHALLLCTSGEKLQVGLVQMGVYVGQLAVSMQVVVVMRRMDIEWQEPFLSVLDIFSFISVEELMESLNAVSCVTRFSPTWQFAFQTMAVPMAFMTGPVLVHLQHVCTRKRRKWSPKLHVLGETFGMMCMLFFIVLCTAVLEPFDCVNHPNLALTMRTATEVLCNFRDEHLSLSLVAGSLTLLPIGFVSVCAWLVLVELPKRIYQMDVNFIRSCSFLLSRFRPGNQAFAIFLLVRNAIVALAPIIPSVDGGCFLIFAMLGSNLCLTAVFQPWVTRLTSYTDVLANLCFLIILLQGAFYVENVTGPGGMIVCSVVLFGILLVFLGLLALTLAEHFLRKRRKNYQFFVTHQKMTCGSLARLVKLELQQRGCSVFLDTDDLSSLVHLFATLSRNVANLLVIASPNLLTRRWCVGEIVTANIHNVNTMIVTLPGFHFPDAMFIAAFDTVVGELQELAAHGIGKPHIAEALRTLRDKKTVFLQERFQSSDIAEMIQQIYPSKMLRKHTIKSVQPAPGSPVDGTATSCLILANHDDTEALATAYVLRTWMFPHLLPQRVEGPFVISPDERILELGQEGIRYLLIVCTKDCLEAPAMIQWFIQSYHFAAHCRIFPIIADEDFHVPGAALDYQRLSQSPNVLAQNESLPDYLSVAKVLFSQIAARFSARYSAESTLKSKAERYAAMLSKLEPLGTLLITGRAHTDFSEIVGRLSPDVPAGHRAEAQLAREDVNEIPDNEEMTEVAF